MDSRGRGGDGGVRRGRRGRSGRDRGWRGRGVGGNRGNEPGEASSSQVATQEESLPSDSLHQSNQPARPSFPPPRPPSRTRHPPRSFRYNYNDRDFNEEGNLPPSPSAPLNSVQRDFPAAREVQPQRQGALHRRERNLAAGSQQTGQSDSSRTARHEPVRNLELDIGPPNTSRKRRTTVHQQGSSTRWAQNQALPQQAQTKILPQHFAFNSQNFNAPAPGLPAGQVSVQGIGGLGALAIAPGGPVASIQQKEEKPFPDPRPFSYAKPDPIHILPLKKRKIAIEIMDGGNQGGAPADGNPPEEQQGNPDGNDSTSDAGKQKESSKPK